jgi:hypothetical protein
VLLVVAGALAFSPCLGSGGASVGFGNPRLAYTLRIPAGWKASVRRVDGVTLITSLPVPNRNDNPERIRLRRGGVYIWIADYGPVTSSGVRPRPNRIELGNKSGHACGFGEGYMLHFTDKGRLLQIFVKLGPATSTRTARAVLNSLRVTR